MKHLFSDFVSHAIVTRLGWGLFHSLWLFTLAALCVWIALRLTRRTSSNTRYLTACAALFVMPAMIVAAAAIVPLPSESETPDASVFVTPVEAFTTQQSETPPIPALVPNAAEAGRRTATVVAPTSEPFASTATPLHTDRWFGEFTNSVSPWLPTIVTCWLIGVVLLSVRPFASWLTVRRLRTKGTSDIPSSTQTLLTSTAKALGLRRPVNALQSVLVESPVVIGCLKPLILLPASALTGLSTNQLQALLAHEIAHIQRHDYLVNVIQNVVETLFFYHPAVWWVSRIIRNERENCCDDVAVELCSDKALYAAALLAMDRLRPTSPSLALSAHGGSLLCRIRRLAGLNPSDRSMSNWWATGLIVLAAALTVALVLPLSSEARATMDESSTEEIVWGEPVDGLRMRVVPVHFGMSEENVDMSAVQRNFAAQKELAFAIELENVSDQPIKVLDTGYGNSFGASSGKPASDWYSQFLFTIDYFDADGKPIDYPRVEHVMPSMILGSTKISEIAAGASHRILIRPEKWRSIHYQRLPHRKYTAVVHYHGMDRQAADHIREREPDKEVLSTWSGDVASAATNFQIARRKLPGTSLSWGEPDNGLRAALSFAEDIPWYGYGQDLDLLLHVQNVSDKPVTLASEMWLSTVQLSIRDQDGNEVKSGATISRGGITPMCRTTLLPQQTIVLGAGNLGVEKEKAETDALNEPTHGSIVVPTGGYRLSLTFDSRFVPRMEDGKGNRLAPLDGDYVGIMVTGDKYLPLKDKAFDMDAEVRDNASTPRQWAEIYVDGVRELQNADGTYPSSVFDPLREFLREHVARTEKLPGHTVEPGNKAWEAAINARETWMHDELMAHVRELSDYAHDVVSEAHFRRVEASKYPRDVPIPGRAPTADELANLKFGPAAANGLRAAWQFDSEGAANVGQAIGGRMVIHNSGNEAVTISVEPWGMSTWTVRNRNGQEVRSRIIPIAFWHMTYVRLRLEPGQIADVLGEPLGFGALSVVDHRLATRWVPAVGGDVLTVSGEVELGKSKFGQKDPVDDEFMEPLPIGKHTFAITGGNVIDPEPRNTNRGAGPPAATDRNIPGQQAESPKELPLERKVSLSANRMPLQESLQAVCEEAGMLLDLDGSGLKFEGYTRNMPVTIELEKIKLREALDQITKPFDRMAWTISQNSDAPPGGRIFVSSKSGVEEREADAAESFSERKLSEIVLTGIIRRDDGTAEAWLRYRLDKHLIVRQDETIAIENREFRLTAFGTTWVDWQSGGETRRLKLGASFDRLEDVKPGGEDEQASTEAGDSTYTENQNSVADNSAAARQHGRAQK